MRKRIFGWDAWREQQDVQRRIIMALQVSEEEKRERRGRDRQKERKPRIFEMGCVERTTRCLEGKYILALDGGLVR